MWNSQLEKNYLKLEPIKTFRMQNLASAIMALNLIRNVKPGYLNFFSDCTIIITIMAAALGSLISGLFNSIFYKLLIIIQLRTKNI